MTKFLLVSTLAMYWWEGISVQIIQALWTLELALDWFCVDPEWGRPRLDLSMIIREILSFSLDLILELEVGNQRWAHQRSNYRICFYWWGEPKLGAGKNMEQKGNMVVFHTRSFASCNSEGMMQAVVHETSISIEGGQTLTRCDTVLKPVGLSLSQRWGRKRKPCSATPSSPHEWREGELLFRIGVEFQRWRVRASGLSRHTLRAGHCRPFLAVTRAIHECPICKMLRINFWNLTPINNLLKPLLVDMKEGISKERSKREEEAKRTKKRE